MTIESEAGGWQENLAGFWVNARRAPEVVILLLASAAGAVWVVLTGPFSGTPLIVRWPLLVSTIVVIVWLSLYLVLALAYLGVSDNRSPRSLLRSLALCLFLVVASVASRVMTKAPFYWDHWYAKYLYLLFFTVFWFALFLRIETGALWLKIWKHPRFTGALWPKTWIDPRFATPVAFTVIFGAAALAVLGMETATFLLTGRKWSMGLTALSVNVLILGSLFALVFTFTSRIWATILFVCTVYIGFGLSNIAKITYMHSAVQPLDLLYVPEFIPQFESTFGMAPSLAFFLASIPFAAGILLIWKSKPRRMPLAHRAMAGLVFVLLPISVMSGIYRDINDWDRPGDIRNHHWNSVESSAENGFLLEFALHLPDLFIKAPSTYSQQAVTHIVDQYSRSMFPGTQAGLHEPVNLVVYLIESLMDPADLGLRFTSEPIPTIRSLSATHTSGYAIVPGAFGKSASTEFELLTGMAMFFLPESSTPYKQYIKRDLPSMPCLLKRLGYHTAAVQADPVIWYNRRQVYRHLCVDDAVWLGDDPQVPRDITGWWVSDEAIVDNIIKKIQATPEHKPFFILAFPSSTHHPYDHGAYRDSDLDVVDAVAGSARDEVKFYINAVRVADLGLKKLIQYVEGMREKTIVVVLGDHVPPLSAGALLHFYDDTRGSSTVASRRKRHKVPLLIWSNFSASRDTVEMSLNALPLYLLTRMGIEPRGFLGFVNEVRSQLPVLSSFVQDATGTQWLPDGVPDRYQELIRAYELLQYDILFGKGYSLRPGGD